MLQDSPTVSLERMLAESRDVELKISKEVKDLERENQQLRRSADDADREFETLRKTEKHLKSELVSLRSELEQTRRKLDAQPAADKLAREEVI